MLNLRALELLFRILSSFSCTVSSQGHSRWYCEICPGSWTRYPLGSFSGAARNASVVISSWTPDPSLADKLVYILTALKRIGTHQLGRLLFFSRHVLPIFQVSSLLLFSRDWTQFSCVSCSVSICYFLRDWLVCGRSFPGHMSPLGVWMSLRKD